MRSQVTGVESPTGGTPDAPVRSRAAPADRATPLVLRAIAPRATPAPGSDWPVLVAARREAEETWADFLEGDASVYDLMRARRQLDFLIRRR